ncbi:MAG TPA: FliH/SctL family protein [Verrucomicrobiae bacterium]|nr:FliH/SctL family protein [Verrucomicrobiae bacterium]
MKPRRENFQFALPLRDVKLARSGDRETLRQQDLDASYERGRIEGERRLSEQLIQQRAELMELQTGVLSSLQQSVPQVVRETERALIALALEAAQKLVAGLPISPEMMEGVIHEACAAVEDTADLSVLLHPDDLAMLERTNSPVLLPKGGQERLHFQSSSQVTRGGCIVQTHFGVLDARRETKAGMLEKTLLP